MKEYDIIKAAGLFIKDKKVLVAKSKDDDRYMNVGGKLELGETYEEALIREVKEETGVDISHGNITHFLSVDGVAFGKNAGKTIHLQSYLINGIDPEVRASNEIEELRWVDSSDIGKVPLASIIEKHIMPKLKSEGYIN